MNRAQFPFFELNLICLIGILTSCGSHQGPIAPSSSIPTQQDIEKKQALINKGFGLPPGDTGYTPLPLASPTAASESGELYKRYTEIISKATFQGACDKNKAKDKLEIAAALDSKAKEIADFAENHATYTVKDKVVQPKVFGDLQIIEIPLDPATKDDWKLERSYLWPDLIAQYQKIKSMPVNGDWVALDHAIRGLSDTEEKRLDDGINYSLTHALAPLVPDFFTTLVNCYNSQLCNHIDLDSKFDPLLVDDYYKSRIQEINALFESGNTARAKKSFKLFLDFIRLDNYITTFHPYDQIKRSSVQTLEVPLTIDPSFTEAKAAIQNYLETIWKNDKLSVHIHWLDTINPKIIFEYLVAGFNYRAGTSWQDRQILLGKITNNKIISHEFGHAMGLPDHYYESWNEQDCGYYIDLNYGDVMSNDETGLATPEDLAEIDSNYPFAGATP